MHFLIHCHREIRKNDMDVNQNMLNDETVMHTGLGDSGESTLTICLLSDYSWYTAISIIFEVDMVGKPLSWNEIKSRALAFSKEWAEASYERGQAQTFWNEFFNVFGVVRQRVARFEENVKKLGGGDGFIDLFWKGELLIEHKSRGRDLDKAYSQAMDYFPGLKDYELPKRILVSDFARFKLYDLVEGDEYEFALNDFHENVNLFGFIPGYQTRKIQAQDPVNVKAAEKMGKLHDQMKAVGYEGHPLEVYLVRLLFCLYAEDTTIFEKQQFTAYIEDKTNEDGSDLANHMSQLFEVLNTPEEKRLKNLDEHLAAFPYINGKLFEERLPHAGFDTAMRDYLLECCSLDWGRISPAIFGSLFQSIMDKDARRNLGAHYTSEENILKLINPLFMDELNEEFDRISKLSRNTRQLKELHERLGTLKFLDPACGCGNFLIIAYRELRLLELKILNELNKHGELEMDISILFKIDVDQFYGIEIEEFPAQIAQVAMWLMDNQMNVLASQALGNCFARLPLKNAATIVHGNALRLDWEDIVPKSELNYILGNPPFVGKKARNKDQVDDMDHILGDIRNAGILDYVAAWYLKSAEYIFGTTISCALVSTNSIVQGEQVSTLWKPLIERYGLQIAFAHRTFKWSNEAKGNAAVHVAIIGFCVFPPSHRELFEYENVNSEPLHRKVGFINPYLVEARNIFLEKRRASICDVPPISFGSMPNDGGHFLLSDEEKIQFLSDEPDAESFVKPLISSREYINGKKRWCIWLDGAAPSTWRNIDSIRTRVEAVRVLRAASSRSATKKLADTPSVFGEIRQPDSQYILIPRHSSENRTYIPMSFFDPSFIVSDSCLAVGKANLYMFGILKSAMHMAWVRNIGGRIKSDYRYSVELTYNNFPWPKNPSDAKKAKIEDCAQVVLDTREKYPDSSLADLYDPLAMPTDLLKAHQALDRAADSAYGKVAFKSEAERVSFLFDLYQKYTKEEE